jgi:hypothetical protein
MAWLEHSPDVVFTELEEGAVLLALDRGLYFSLDGVGLEIWRSLPAAGSIDDLVERLGRRYAADGDELAAAAGPFVERLRDEALVREASGEQAATLDESPREDGERRPFRPPQLVQHDEPLHEVAASPFDPQLPLAE